LGRKTQSMFTGSLLKTPSKKKSFKDKPSNSNGTIWSSNKPKTLKETKPLPSKKWKKCYSLEQA
jgi:hypothetical protein